MSKTFLQYDSKWAKHLYPLKNKKGSTMATSGCGPTSVACIVYNVKPSITPPKVADYSSSIGGATEGGATYHSAIPKLCKHYGLECVEREKMSKVFSDLEDDKYAILLFDGGTRGGITWTLGGHYIACTAIKVQNGKHYLYMRDSGQRKHIGWYCYETQMKGLIKKAWVVTVPKQATTQTKPSKPAKQGYSGKLPTFVIKKGETSDRVKQIQKFLNWYGVRSGKVDGVFGNGTYEGVKKFQKKVGLPQTGKVNPETLAKMKKVKK